MDNSGKRLLHYYQKHHNKLVFALLFQLSQKSDYKFIYIVINGKTRRVPLNILSSVILMFYKGMGGRMQNEYKHMAVKDSVYFNEKRHCNMLFILVLLLWILFPM